MRKIKELIFLAFILLVILLLGEILLRIFLPSAYGVPYGAFIEDKEIKYIPKPNFKGYIYNHAHEDYKLNFVINSDGLRDYDYSIQKPKGTYRIITLGDSETFPDEIQLYEQFGKLLEKKLNNSTEINKFEVINFGVSGYDTNQSILFFKRKGLKYNPDLVIYFFNPNDILDCSEGGYYLFNGLRVSKEFIKKPIIIKFIYTFLYKHCYVCRELYRTVKSLKNMELFSNKKVLQKIDDIEKNLRIYESLIFSFKKFLEYNNITFIILDYPLSAFDLQNKTISYKINQKNKLIASKYNILYIDPTYQFIKNGDYEKFKFNSNGHINVLGHKLLSEILFKKLIDKLPLTTNFIN